MTALRMESEAEQRARVADVAREWVGTPYHHAARLKGVGVDCAQLIAAVFHEARLIAEVPFEMYPPDWMLHRSEPRFQQTVERYAYRVNRPPEIGDIVLFQWGRSLAHGGIVVGWPMLVHAYAKGRAVTVSSGIAEGKLVKKFGGVWTLKGWA